MTTNTTISPSGAAVALVGTPTQLFPAPPVIEVGIDQRVRLYTRNTLINGAAGEPIRANGTDPTQIGIFPS